MVKKPCPDAVATYGARSLKAVRLASRLAHEMTLLAKAAEDTKPEMLAAGIRNMEYAKGLDLLKQVEHAPFLIQMAHDSFRQGLGRAGFQEPNDHQIMQQLKEIGEKPELYGYGAGPQPQGPGGGGR